MGIEIYAGGRHCGKTAWIIEKSSRIGIPIAVVSARHSVEIMKLAKDMGLSQRGQSFLNECTMEVFVRLAQREDFLERLRKINTFTHHLK